MERTTRAKLFNETLEVVRKCWTDELVNHDGEFFQLNNLRVLPKPQQQPPEVWLGGIAPSELKRVGRTADGWLPSFVTPADGEGGWATITEHAKEHNRSIDPEHFGVLIPYALGEVPNALIAGLAARRPDLADPSVLVPNSWDALTKMIQEFISVGASKFVVLPIVEPTSATHWISHLEEASRILLPLQN